MLSTSYPGIPVHSDTNSASPGSMQLQLGLLCEDFTREGPAFYYILLAEMLFADFIL